MYSFICVTLIVLLTPFQQQNTLSESQAVSYLQQVLVSQFDKDLPNVAFGTWFNQTVGESAGVTWILTDCGDPAILQSEGDLPGCVEVTAMLPNYRKVVVATRVGTFKKGVSGRPRLKFIAIEDKGELYNVNRLSHLPDMIRMSVIKPEKTPVRLPEVSFEKYPKLLYRISPVENLEGADTAPIPYRSDRAILPVRMPKRVSEGVLLGSVITRVMPEYPVLARQNRITGEVLVNILIAEDGRVVEAAAMTGPPVLRKVAEEAARKWIFKPTILNGLPVRIQGTLTFIFSQP